MWKNRKKITHTPEVFSNTRFSPRALEPGVREYVWHDLFVRAPWLSSYVWHDPFACVHLEPLEPGVREYVWHDVFIGVSWTIHMWEMSVDSQKLLILTFFWKSGVQKKFRTPGSRALGVHMRMSHVTRMNWVMAHVRTIHVTHTHTHQAPEALVVHIRMRNVKHMKWVMTHVRMSHVTHTHTHQAPEALGVPIYFSFVWGGYD